MSLISTTIVIEAVSTTGSIISSSVGEEENRKKRRNLFIGTSVASTASYVSAQFTSCKNNEEFNRQRAEIAEQTRQEYVSSRTNEELELALRELEAQEQSSNSYVDDAPKTYRK